MVYLCVFLIQRWTCHLKFFTYSLHSFILHCWCRQKSQHFHLGKSNLAFSCAQTVKDTLCINSFSVFGNSWRCIHLLHFVFYIQKYSRIIFQVFINLERKTTEYQDNLPLGQGPKLQAPKQDSSNCFARNTGLAGRQHLIL